MALDITFTVCRQRAFLEDIADEFEDMELDAFIDNVYNFDNVSDLDHWCLTLLSRAVELIKFNQDEGLRQLEAAENKLLESSSEEDTPPEEEPEEEEESGSTSTGSG